MIKETVVLIFIDKKGKILLQKRGTYSKGGEKLGYFGGNIEEGENPLEALVRELQEEIRYIPEKIKFWKKVDFVCSAPGKYNNFNVTIYIFVSPLDRKAEEIEVYEGEGKVVTTLDKELENKNIIGGYEIVLKKIKENLAEVLALI
jgi:mutator protein MutT